MNQLDPKAVWLLFINYSKSIFTTGIFSLAMLGFVLKFSAWWIDFDFVVDELDPRFAFLGWLWLIIPLFLIGCWFWAKLAYRFYRYELTETGFRKESGVISKQYVTIPYDRIQNVDIYRGFIARLLGLSDLQIQTAGTSYTEGWLPGLSITVAEQLRDEVIQRARHSKQGGL